ncbi:Endonuclease/exonuclease/phosphatase [Mycena maculata]|uniref:DNA-(apurinic or apyrimidinic site) endonuclease n=1 Tax=Mycena maculata TaxID=230809 RepID=A0AAD7HG55_9AGAR|nr:Endonuclease/exonuclease/phosphatase [Mycena maculata]
MRILTWNINGVRTIPQYHPWNTMKTHDDILNLLQADIICFQEMKTSRQNLPKAVGVPPSYHSFFSFPLQKNGYSGVAVYARAGTALPLKAEEGLTGLLQPKPPLSAVERVSVRDAYPDEIMADEAPDLNFRDLDSEGRALVIDFGLFVLINVYCPNDGTETEERLEYKMHFHRMLEARVKGLIQVEKREVIVVGDLNACAAVVDHCEGSLMVTRGQAAGMSGEDGFWERDVRRWLRDWLISDDGGSKGCLVDVVRRFWPDRKGMYTCWNTKISARESNYGTRIDYILVTPGLLPWVKAADIQPEIKGSDHCPVFIDLHEQIIDAHGSTVNLRDVLRPGVGGAEPPRITAKFWDEYKQRSLDAFFGKKTDSAAKLVFPPLQSPESEIVFDSHTPLASHLPHPGGAGKLASDPNISSASPRESTADHPSPASQSSERSAQSTSSAASTKRKSSTQEPVASSSKKQKKDASKPKKVGQTSLASFFSKPTVSALSYKIDSSVEDMLEADYKLALSLSQRSSPPRSSSSSSGGSGKSKKAWTDLLAPIQPPKCIVHGEPAKELTVNKPGPNKGKNFFICARPVGPGYDKGKAERLREEVDPQWKCDFFKWSSEVRLEMTRKRSVNCG